MEADSYPLVEIVQEENEPMDTDAPAIQELHPVQSQQQSQVGSSTMQQDSELSGSYNWRIPDFITRNMEKFYSDKFEIGTYIWRLLVFPKDNQLGVFLDYPEASCTPPKMSPRADFKLILVNHQDPSKPYIKETNHHFTGNAADWGFDHFLATEHMNLNPNSPYVAPDGSLELRVELNVHRDQSYDARKETGYVGLKNQGATCYMNSLMQYLYMLPYFRKAVYHMPTVESDEPRNNMPLALQSLFFKLQFSQISVSTKDLTSSFGWGSYDAFMQHDAHELNRVLCEKLEDKMKGTKVERTNQELFEGQILNYLKCLNVDYTSERKEEFADLQLNVRGCKNVYDSFIKYTEEEDMVGDNQYNAEGHGMQDAKKGLLFNRFPPVLQLHLKRFEYDYARDVSTKVNDRYEFFDELDLDMENGRLLSPNADHTVRNLYKLFAVLVHQGNSGGGHYYAYMRPDGKTWYKFDDERVTKEDGKAATEGQFGGEDDLQSTGYQQSHMRRAAPSNAYMLVYVRVSDWDNVFCPVTKEDMNVHLLKRLERELGDKERKHKEKMEAHQFVTIKVATDADIKQQVNSGIKAFDLVDHDLLPAETSHFRLRKQTRFSEVKQMMAQRLQVPPEQQRYWTWAPRPNTTMRAYRVLTPQEEDAQLVDLRDLREQGPSTAKHAMMDIRLYLELPGRFGKMDPNAQLIKRPENSVLTFIKSYIPETERLKYLGRAFLYKDMRIQEVMDMLCSRSKDLDAGLPEGGPLEIWEEVKKYPTLVADRLNPLDTVGKRANDMPMDGDIFIAQRAVSDSEKKSSTIRYPDVASYLAYIRNRRFVNFRQLSNPKEEGFTLQMWQDDNYDSVALAVSQKLGLQPTDNGAAKLRFTPHSTFHDGPQRQALKFRGTAKLQNMLALPTLESQRHALPGGAASSDIMYYEILDIPLEQLERLKTLKVYFHKENTEQGSEHTVRVPREGKVEDVLQELARQLGPDAKQRVLRLMEVHSSKLYKIMHPNDDIAHVDDTYWRLRAEFVPEDEIELREGERLLHCYHMSRKMLTKSAGGSTVMQPASAVEQQQQQQLPQEAGNEQGQAPQLVVNLFGDPFLLKIGPSETLGSLKQRVKAKLCITDEEFKQWRFWFWSQRSNYELLGDDSVDVGAKVPMEESNSFTSVPYLGLEHRDDKPSKRQPSNYQSQQQIKIK